MHGIVAAVGVGLAKRAAAVDRQAPAASAGPWLFVILFLNIIIFTPLLVVVVYTVGSVFTTLAMVEDANASARYVELSPSLDDGDFDDDGQPPNKPRGASRSAEPSTDAGLVVTSSLRSTFRHLFRLGGWRSLFRGLFCSWVVSVATAIVGAAASLLPFVPYLVGTLIANLALVHLYTAWVHIVISAKPVSIAFWRRVPSFRRAFDATKYVVLMQWLATTFTQYLVYGVALLLGLPRGLLKVFNPDPPSVGLDMDPTLHSNRIALWKHLVILATVLFCLVFVQVPALVALVRVQASILPPEEDTVVPFDRSFGGAVEPAVINGSASVSIRDALRTFSRESWIRLYKMMAKAVLLSVALAFLIAAVVAPQIMLLLPSARPASP